MRSRRGKWGVAKKIIFVCTSVGNVIHHSSTDKPKSLLCEVAMAAIPFDRCLKLRQSKSLPARRKFSELASLVAVRCAHAQCSFTCATTLLKSTAACQDVIRGTRRTAPPFMAAVVMTIVGTNYNATNALRYWTPSI